MKNDAGSQDYAGKGHPTAFAQDLKHIRPCVTKIATHYENWITSSIALVRFCGVMHPTLSFASYTQENNLLLLLGSVRGSNIQCPGYCCI